MYELYDIVRDPGERSDISDQCEERKEKMADHLKRNVEEYRQSFEKMKVEDDIDWQEWWSIWK